MTITILDLYRLNKDARHLIDIFAHDYKQVTSQEFAIPETKALKVDAGKIISGEAKNDEKNPGENIILVDTVYDGIRTLVYSSPNKTTNFYAALDNSDLVIAKSTIPYSEAENDECAVNPDFTFRQTVIGALTSKLIF